MSDAAFIAEHRTIPSAFVRVRKLGFRLLVLFLLNQVKGALQREIDDFFVRALGRHLFASVTSAAVCIARRALRYTVFEALNQRFLQRVGAGDGLRRWHGLRVMAVDGSILNLPATPELFRHFSGQVQRGRRLPMARLSQLLDVESGLTWHAIVAPLTLCERVLAADHVELAPADAVLLYDRGYPSFFLLAWHRHQQRSFCMRLPRGFHVDADALFESADAPRRIRVSANAAARKQCQEHEVGADALDLRLIRVVLSSGEVEILATALLDEDQYPQADFAALYAQRWSIEGDFRIQKSRLQMENFTGKRPHAIHQDVHARILTKNLACWLTGIAQAALDAVTQTALAAPDTTAEGAKKPPKPPKHRQRINLTDALHAFKHALIQVMLGATDQLEHILKRLPRHRHCERKHRSTPRDMRKSKAAIRFPIAYKQTG